MRRLSRLQPRSGWVAPLLLAALASTGLSARAESLDFPSSFSNLYGDQPGVLDVSHWVMHGGERIDGLNWWSFGYDELQGVAWSVHNGADTVAHFELRVLDGQPLRLDGFRLGSWSGADGRLETVTVTPLGGSEPVYSYTGLIGLNDLSNAFEIGLVSSTGFSIAWTHPWWIAIDDIRFQTAAAVPEPSAAALMCAGLAGLGVLGRLAGRRRGPDAPPD